MEYHVELLGHQYNDKELIVRYETDLETGNRFFSDLNGFQIIARQTLEKIPLQGNYYPMPSLAFIQGGNGHRFSVHSHQALGVASLKTGALEVMLDRRLTRDDERGLGQGVLDNRPMDIHFHLLFETSNTALPATKASSLHLPSLLSHRALMQLSYPVHKFLGKVESALDAKSSLLRKTFSPLALEFPCDLHIVSLKVPEPLEFFRSTAPEKYALTIHRQGWDVSYFKKDRLLCSKGNHDGGSLDLSELFKNLYVKNAKVSSLNLAHDISNGELGSEESLGRKQRAGFGGKKTMISLSAMEIQSLRLELINGKNLY
jgi:alpha-mannosidase II